MGSIGTVTRMTIMSKVTLLLTFSRQTFHQITTIRNFQFGAKAGLIDPPSLGGVYLSRQ